MPPSIEVSEHPRDGAHRLTLVATTPSGPLTCASHLGAGVHLTVDVLDPQRWLRLSADVDETTSSLLTALVGAPIIGAPDAAIEPGWAGPWLRVAAVDALDRFLHVPVDQALVDAERAVTRFRAAETLPAVSDARHLVVGDALRLARRASAGLAAQLRRRSHRPLPPALRAAFGHLADGYAALAAQVAGPDRELDAVQRAWRALQDGSEPPTPARAGGRSRRRIHPRCSDLLSQLDPRQVPARVLALSPDPAQGEVRLRSAPGGAVRVEVPAFGPIAADVAGRLLVRLVDRRTHVALGHGLLTASPRRRSAHRHWFVCTLPLARPDVDALRVDVFDALGAAPAAAGETDVQEARRAATFLREWRGLVAAARLADAVPGIGARMADLAARLQLRDTAGLVGPDEAGTLMRIRDRSGGEGGGDGALWSASGAGRLLVAELAAANESGL